VASSSTTEHEIDNSSDETTEMTEMAARLRLSATRLARRLRQESASGRTPSQLSALASIEQHGPVTLGALAEHERVAPPTITNIVAKLEADGFVSRQIDPADRRFARVAVTETGALLLAEIRQRKTTWLAGRISALDADQQTALSAALDALEALSRA
jgi:DNA-binding MarR family transcriptional regulator